MILWLSPPDTQRMLDLQIIPIQSSIKPMNSDLKDQIFSIVKDLKTAGKVHLAKCIEENWSKTCLAYSQELNQHEPDRPIEKEMLDAFKQELSRLEVPETKIQNILYSLNKNRVLQTAPHLGITESPRMLCINWLGSLGVKEEDYYVVGMFSGIPLSNKSRPGRINNSSVSINLFPSNMQDELVYQSKVTDKFITEAQNLPTNLRSFIPEANTGSSYTKIALDVCEKIESRILKKENMVYLDINEVVSAYLLQILEKKEGVIYKILFDDSIKSEFLKEFPDEIMFYGPGDGKMESFFLKDNKLISKTKEISLEDPNFLIQEIKESRLCPALLIGFISIAFLNRFKCLGSFAQVEYLPTYQKKLAKLSIFKDMDLSQIPTENLTTGVFPNQLQTFPVDIINGQNFGPDPQYLFGELLVPMKQILYESYFTGDKRLK